MATTFNYTSHGYPKFRVVVNSVTITNRTATSAKVNYDITLTINGWYHYDLNFTVKCGNGSKTHKINPWGTKNDNSNTYRDARNIKGSFTITNLNQSSSNPGVQYSFKSTQNSHGNVTFGSTNNKSSTSVKVPAYTGNTTSTPKNSGSGNTNNKVNVPSSAKDALNNVNQNKYTIDTLTGKNELNSTTSKKRETVDYTAASDLMASESELKKCGILGIPFQFNSYADVRSSQFGYSNIGRTYSNFIWNNMPLVYIEVGKPLYFDSITKTSDDSIASFIKGLFGSGSESDIAEDYEKNKDYVHGLGGVSQSRYYTFLDDFDEYRKYANTMIKFVSIMMGLGEEICYMTDKKYREFDILDLRHGSFFDQLISGEFLAGNYLTFYYNPEQTSITESGANSAGESVMSTMFSNVNALSREIQYLFGTEMVSNIGDIGQNASALAQTISDLAGGLNIEGSGLYQRICSIGSCLSGANILFPHIWQDSQFAKSYTLNFKFSTPYGDPESVLMNVYIPYLCLLALSLPRQASTQGYKSPFLVKLSCKGYFNCDMGMVESIDIKRGGPNNDQWTVDGLPTEMEVTMTVRDLYPTIVAAAASASDMFFANNSAFTEYLSMLSGVELHVVTPMDRTYALLQMMGTSLVQLPENIGKHFKITLQSKLKWWFRKFLE